MVVVRIATLMRNFCVDSKKKSTMQYPRLIPWIDHSAHRPSKAPNASTFSSTRTNTISLRIKKKIAQVATATRIDQQHVRMKIISVVICSTPIRSKTKPLKPAAVLMSPMRKLIQDATMRNSTKSRRGHGRVAAGVASTPVQRRISCLSVGLIASEKGRNWERICGKT